MTTLQSPENFKTINESNSNNDTTLKTNTDIKNSFDNIKAPDIHSLKDSQEYAKNLVEKYGKEFAIFHIEELILFIGVRSGGHINPLVEALKYIHNEIK